MRVINKYNPDKFINRNTGIIDTLRYGSKISIKIHPEQTTPRPLSPYQKLLKSIEQTIQPVFRNKRGNPAIAPTKAHTVHQRTAAKRKGGLFVGIDKYRHWPTLDCAVNDAKALAHHFEILGYETNVLTDEEATRANVERVMEKVVAEYDSFVVAFFGHGIAPHGVGGMFVPVDAGEQVHAYDKIHCSTI